MEIIIGTIAAILTTGAFIPQTIKIIITKKTAAISFWMYFFFTIGIVFWIIYGFILNVYPIIIANVITFILSLTILIIKIINIKKDNVK